MQAIVIISYLPEFKYQELNHESIIPSRYQVTPD